MMHRQLLLIGTAIVGLLVMMGQAIQPNEFVQYTTISGFFEQDNAATDPNSFDYTTNKFGLIDQVYDTDAAYDPKGEKTQWQRFDHKVWRLNRESGRLVQYKILFLARHGEGYHNVAESFYGTPAWNCYWALRDGNGTSVWADAKLTEEGIAQAVKAHNFWAKMIEEQNIVTPESYYTSPLYRCLDTANITFFGLKTDDRHPFIPQVKEMFREAIGRHTCDRRSNKTYIHESFPSYTFEVGFAEEDPLWDPAYRETSSAQDARSKTVLDDVFGNDSNTYISVSAHSGEISSILRVIGHRAFRLSTGQVIPVLVRQDIVEGTAPTTTIEPWTTISTCTTPPATSTPA
ncbi:phosphoglycerate mutase [Bisporella sp. PMI_857]|nr:phosphoglycerate mutase [Bisporella sp. PMI_857]